MCALCKMAISEKGYAAEAIDNDGSTYKFDNPMCLIRYMKGRNLKPRIAAYYIADYDTRSWLDARSASYVKSADIPSPMASGLAAFGSRATAGRFAAERHGTVITFEDLWNSAQ